VGTVPTGPNLTESPFRHSSGPREAMLAVTRLLGVAAEMHGPEAVHGRLVSEARELFGLTHAVLLSVAGREGRAEALAAAPGLALPRGSL
jgi:hypothetical protein